MCAILGIGFLKGHRIKDFKTIQKVLEILFAQSEARGGVSTGVAFTAPKGIDVLKRKVNAKSFIQTEDFKEISSKNLNESSGIISVIGHCRFPTKGSANDNVNNHPILTDNVVGVHNGMIGNDDDLFDEFSKLGAEGWKREGMVDSEIIFRLIDYYAYSQAKSVREAIIAASGNLWGGFACAVVSRRNKYSVWLFRNHNPIFVSLFPQKGVVIFSSSPRFIEASVEDAGLGRSEEITISQNKGVELDLHRNSRTEFNLEKATYGGI